MEICLSFVQYGKGVGKRFTFKYGRKSMTLRSDFNDRPLIPLCPLGDHAPSEEYEYREKESAQPAGSLKIR